MEIDNLIIQFNTIKKEEEDLRIKTNNRDNEVENISKNYKEYEKEIRKEIEYLKKKIENLNKEFNFLKKKFKEILKKELLEKLEHKINDISFEELVTEEEFIRLIERYKNS